MALEQLKGTGVVIYRIGQEIMEKAIQGVREKSEAAAAAKRAALQAGNDGASATPKSRSQKPKTISLAQRENLLKAHKAWTIPRADEIDWKWLAAKVNGFDGNTINEAIEKA